MLKNNIKVLLDNYHPIFEEEKLYKKKMIDFSDKYSDCFDRSCSVGHFTGSAWLLNKDKTKVLLLHHAKLDRWFQLGGHCDGNPNLLDVSVKECKEESGIQQIIPIQESIFDIDIHKIPKYKNEPEHIHYDIRFLLKVNSDEKVIKNRESKELKWFTKEKSRLPTKSKSILRMFDKWLNL